MIQVKGNDPIWVTRLNEGLALLDQLVGNLCECQSNWEKGIICIQCHARKMQTCIKEGGVVESPLLEDAFEQVICHVDDFGEVTFSPNHELECVRYWSQLT